jgi:hypothetical protein
MPRAIPLSRQERQDLAERLSEIAAGQDPLSFVQTRIFTRDAYHVARVPTLLGRPPASFFLDVVQYCEMSAWSDDPPLIISLLRAFEPLWSYQQLIDAIVNEGPFRCHPRDQPFWVCRVAAELPLLDRHRTRFAAIQFSEGRQLTGQPGKRVLRVYGHGQNGKSYTLSFFEYLAAIQPLRVGVLHFDFGEGDLRTLAANEGVPVELYVAQRLEAQARRRREDLNARAATAGAGGPLGLPLPNGGAQKRYVFRGLTNEQQRNRWARELASELVDQVLFRMMGVPPSWWVLVFDRCEKAPPEAQELVRQLVERAAGTGPDTVDAADSGPLRVVLLGDSEALLPNPVYLDHIEEEDLTGLTFGLDDVIEYFKIFCLSRMIELDQNATRHDQSLRTLAEESLRRAREIVQGTEPPPWPRALAKAVIEQTLTLEALAAQKRGVA